MRTNQITTIIPDGGSDYTSLVTMRYRLESDPDVDGSYTAVTDTKTFLGVTIYDFDPTTLDPGTYVVHHYLTADGSGTGSKYVVVVAEPILV